LGCCACSISKKARSTIFSSHAFLTKFAVLIIVAFLSTVPTVEFLSWRKEAGQPVIIGYLHGVSGLLAILGRRLRSP
jgi:uncharacterized membrane protein